MPFRAAFFFQNVISPIHHFPETSCRWMSVGRIVILPNSEVTETIMPNIIFSNHYLAERQIHDTSFSRKSFSGIVILPNVFFLNSHLAECHFSESSFSRTSFFRKSIERNEHDYLIETWMWLLLLLIPNSYGLLNNKVIIRKIT